MNNNLIAEQSVIGAVLINSERFYEISDLITHNDFEDGRHRDYYKAISYLADDNQPIDIITVCEKLSDLGFVPDISYLTDIAKSIPSTSNIKSYAKAVKNASTERRMLCIANEMISIVYGEGSTQEKQEWIDQLTSKTTEQVGNTVRDAQSIMRNVVETWQERFEHKGELIGYSTGFHAIDQRTMGLQAPDLVVIAAQSGKGKTTLAMNMAKSVAIDQCQPVLVFSLEMSGEQLMDRMVASVGKIPFSMIRKGTALGSDYDHAIMPTVSKINQSQLFIDDRGGLTIAQIKSTARKFFRELGGGMIVVDYIGLVKGTGFNKEQQIADVSGSLKSLAKELNVPVLALAQMNRNNVQRGDKRPVSSDLRDSAAIEHDSDCLMMLYEDEVNAPGTTEVHFVKLRNGEPGTDYLTKRLDISSFVDQERGYEPDRDQPKPSKFEY